MAKETLMDWIIPSTRAAAIVGQTISSSAYGKSAEKAGRLTAESELQAGAYNANIIRSRNQQVLSQQQSDVAASGLAAKGSPMDVMMQSAFAGEQNAQAIL